MQFTVLGLWGGKGSTNPVYRRILWLRRDSGVLRTACDGWDECTMPAESGTHSNYTADPKKPLGYALADIFFTRGDGVTDAEFAKQVEWGAPSTVPEVYLFEKLQRLAAPQRYQSCGTHRVAISNHRLISMEDGKVTFRWKDYAHGGKKRKMTLAAEEFIRRFLLHVLPKGLMRIRHYGWMANRCRAQSAALCRSLLQADPPLVAPPTSSTARLCPFCGGKIEVVETVIPRELSRHRLSRKRAPDSS